MSFNVLKSYIRIPNKQDFHLILHKFPCIFLIYNFNEKFSLPLASCYCECFEQVFLLLRRLLGSPLVVTPRLDILGECVKTSSTIETHQFILTIIYCISHAKTVVISAYNPSQTLPKLLHPTYPLLLLSPNHSQLKAPKSNHISHLISPIR